MKSNIRTRLVSGFLAAMMGLSCFSGTAIAAYADDANSEITVSSTAESDQKSVVVDDESAPPENAATDDVSETVKAFLEAVDKINYESILAKANSFGLAQKKWEVNQDDKDLEKQLDEVIAELDEATQPLYTAEDAYSELSEDEKALENVAKAYASHIFSMREAFLLVYLEETLVVSFVDAEWSPSANADTDIADSIIAAAIAAETGFLDLWTNPPFNEIQLDYMKRA